MASKIILITGASTGFGNITAKLLAENGHTVYATMRDTNGKNKAQKDTLLDWAKSHQVGAFQIVAPSTNRRDTFQKSVTSCAC